MEGAHSSWYISSDIQPLHCYISIKKIWSSHNWPWLFETRESCDGFGNAIVGNFIGKFKRHKTAKENKEIIKGVQNDFNIMIWRMHYVNYHN